MLVIGAGSIATGRAKTLCRFGAKLHVVAEDFSSGMREMADRGEITASCRKLDVKDTEDAELFRDMHMVFAATDDRALNEAVTRACRARGIPVNNAQDHTLCDFYFPAIVEGERLVLGLAGDGTNHGSVRRAAARIREMFSGTGGNTAETKEAKLS